MSRLVKILPRPALQLFETASWWAINRSVVQAAQWLTEIETAIQGLADTAPRHPLAREADAFDFPIHQMNFGISNKPTHRILYSFDDSQVLIYAIRHLSQSDLSPDEIEYIREQVAHTQAIDPTSKYGRHSFRNYWGRGLLGDAVTPNSERSNLSIEAMGAIVAELKKTLTVVQPKCLPLGLPGRRLQLTATLKCPSC